ncbi:hypothetical protein PXNS11_30013 [Stutzerimonas xanthomarina]|nr:hypothetical protein PXNS11_30013 [Stutzerimonas xanthomarina]
MLADRDVFGKGLLQTWQQPVDRCGPGAWLAWVQLGPVIAAQVVQDAETCLKSGEGLALEQAPGQPGGGAQILGERGEQHLAAFADLLPVDAGGLVQCASLGQFGLEQFELAAVANIVASEIAVIDRLSGKFQIMLAECAGVHWVFRDAQVRSVNFETCRQYQKRNVSEKRGAQLLAHRPCATNCTGPYGVGILDGGYVSFKARSVISVAAGNINQLATELIQNGRLSCPCITSYFVGNMPVACKRILTCNFLPGHRIGGD